MPIISVVIPVYQVGKYIENSLKSLINQKFKDFEVILVDNNCTDNSIALAQGILRETELSYKIIKQPKQGLPSARNKGIEEAQGEWIISIDPDDTVSPDFLKDLHETAKNNETKFLFSKYKEVDEKHLFDFSSSMPIIVKYNREEILNLCLKREMPLMVSNMFFEKKTFIKNGFVFDEDVILGADLLLLWKILMSQESVIVIDKYLYNHFCRPDSLMTAPSLKKVESTMAGYKKLQRYCTTINRAQLGDHIYCRHVYGLLSTMAIYGSYVIFKEAYGSIYNNQVKKDLYHFPDLRISIMNIILSTNPLFFYLFNHIVRNPRSFTNKIICKFVYK